MSSPYESADLLMKLYELRREPTMREARAVVCRRLQSHERRRGRSRRSARPKSAQFRMVTSYWDMAASFVNNGAIDEKMFNDANGEQFVVYAKIEPFMAAYRDKIGNPNAWAISRRWS